MFPLTAKMFKSQKDMAGINSKINELKDKFKNDKTAQSAAIMALYKEKNINPLAGCLPLIIQIPILIALYQAFIAGFKPESLDMLYGFIGNPGSINTLSFGFIDVSTKSHPLAILSGIAQFVQFKTNKTSAGGQNDPMQALNKQMLYFFPVMIIIIGWNLPAGLVLYWLATTAFSIFEQSYLRQRYK